MTATGLDRRRFLALGSLGAAAVVSPAVVGRPAAAGPAVQAAEGEQSGTAGAGASPGTGPVRMTGDGLGLTPAETAALWTRLAADGRIERDSYSNGGAVAALEAHFAEVLGKERAVFLPTGTLANHLAVRTLAGGTGRAIVQAESHLFNDSGDCVQTLSGITLMPLGPGSAPASASTRCRRSSRAPPAAASRGRCRSSPSRPRSAAATGRPSTRRNSTASPHSRGGRASACTSTARASSRRARPPAVPWRTTSQPFDTVYVSLYKYFNSVSGAVLAGPRALLDELYHVRRMFGAGLPGAWPFAALARHYAPGFTGRFRKALAVSEAFIEQPGPARGLRGGAHPCRHQPLPVAGRALGRGGLPGAAPPAWDPPRRAARRRHRRSTAARPAPASSWG